MWSNNGMSNTEIREYCYQLVKDSEKDGVSPQEAVAIKRRAHVMLSALGDEMPFLSCKDEFIEFNLLQENTVENLLAIEKDLYEYGNDAGQNIFREAIAEFFQLENKNLIELEKKDTIFFKTFRDNYLLTQGESLFEGVAEYLQEIGVPSTPQLLRFEQGECYSNSLYSLYTYLYEDASKERKRAIQSIMQKQGVSVKDLKKCSRMKSK